MDEWKKNVYFVLVEPGEPGNIGASARAIKNMGFKNLSLVRPQAEMTEEGRWFARNAHDVLDSAAVHASVGEAIRDMAVVAGTSRRTGRRRGVILPVEQGAARLRNIAEGNKVAVLFGREAKGLFNDEVDECGFMIKIPSSELQPSLNLAQAVLIIAYELSKCGGPAGDTQRGRQKRYDNSPLLDTLTSHGDLEALHGRITRVLQLLEYVPRGDRNLIKNITVNLKHFIGRAGITEKELNMLLGICTQIEKKIGNR